MAFDQPPVERLRDGIRVVLAGPPNAGKSSLLNAMAGRDAAIVSPISGTTRDRIEAPVVRGGIAWLLIDTAGLAELPGDEIEAIGIARAQAAQAEADILLWLGDPNDAPDHPELIRIHSKADVRGEAPEESVAVSAVTGVGIEALLEDVATRARSLLPAEDAIALNRRQAAHIAESAEALDGPRTDLVIIAEHLRLARAAFDRLTGRTGVEDVLDALFGRFCLGK